MSTALAGFLGIIVGALLTGGIQTATSWLDRRRAGRVAARLLYMHLWWSRDALAAAYINQVWNLDVDWDSFSATWREQRRPLAAVLNTASFLSVSSAFMCLEQLGVIRRNDIETTAALLRDEEDPDVPVFTAKPHYRETYEANLGVAMAVVHLASFTWNERRKGLAKVGTVELSSKDPGLPPAPSPEQTKNPED
jgi:hypothetical protein